MFRLVKVTDKSGKRSNSYGVQYIGGAVFNCTTVEEVVSARFLLITHDGIKEDMKTSGIVEVRVQTSLWGPDTVEVHTRNSIYYLEQELKTIPFDVGVIDVGRN